MQWFYNCYLSPAADNFTDLQVEIITPLPTTGVLSISKKQQQGPIKICDDNFSEYCKKLLSLDLCLARAVQEQRRAGWLKWRRYMFTISKYKQVVKFKSHDKLDNYLN